MSCLISEMSFRYGKDITKMAYTALALQIACRAVNSLSVTDARAAILNSIERISLQVANAKRFLGQDLKLVVLPEYSVTGFPWGESATEWKEKAAFAPNGPEYDAIAKLCQDSQIFLASNHYETDANFPELYFQCSTVFSSSGDLVLRYRRLISMFAPSPFDVWDKYLDIYGLDALVPLANTEIGKLAAIASEEILYPEIARISASKGAEILLHSSSEVSSPLPTPKSITRHARAVENMAYVVSANSGGLSGIAIPENSTDGGSEIIDYKGRVLARAGAGETINACADISLESLREYRRRPGMANLLSRHPMQMWAEAYSGFDAAEQGGLGDGTQVPERDYYLARQKRVIEKLDKAGLI